MAADDKYILAIDLGTSGPKVALVSTQGDLIGSEFEETQLLLTPEGGAEQSPVEWWQAIASAVERLLSKEYIPNERIIAIGITGQWSGTVPVDREGNALGNAIIWMDARGAPYIREITGGVVNLDGYEPGKLYRWLQLTGGTPGHAGKDPIAHILYIKHVQTDLYRHTYKFLEPVDYIGLRLTGEIAASYNSIVLHWMTDNRDIHHIPYHDALIKFSKIDRDKLPDLKPANTVLGTLSPQIAREWGLGENVQVVMGSPDVHSAAVGSGAVRDFEPHLYIGTSSWLTCHVPFKKTDLLHNMAALPSAIPGRYLLTNEQETAGACLQFLRDNLFFHEDELLSGEKPKDVYRLFDQIAERTPPGSEKLIFTPWLYGERAPVDDHLVRGGFFNQSLHTTREHMVRAVFEGVAFNSRWLLQHVEGFIGHPVEEIKFVGGGARSAVWCQIHADILNRPICQMKDPIEVNVRGAALLAASELGYLKYDEIGSRVQVQKTFMPDSTNCKLYDELFTEFIAIYKNNKKAYARLNRTR